MPIEYQTFAAFRAGLAILQAPEDLGEELEVYFRDQVGNALADIQTLVPWYREMNADFYVKAMVNEFCAASVFDGPVGKVTNLFAYKPGEDCKKFYYQRQSTAAIDCWMETQRCVQCGTTTPPSEVIYDSPYCNYVVGGETACNPPYLTGEEDDCRFRSLDDDERIYAVGPDYKVFAAPRFPCNYVLCVQWQGIRRKWDDSNLVPVDQQLREAVLNFVEAKMATKERNSAAARDYFDIYSVNLRMLKARYNDEMSTEPKRDCTAGITQLMAAFNPLYATPAYGP